MKDSMPKPHPKAYGTLKPPIPDGCPNCECARCTEACSETMIGKSGSKPADTPHRDKTTLFLNGLSCADCAEKIKKRISMIPGVSDVQMDFVGQKLVIGATQGQIAEILSQAVAIINQIEPHVKVTQQKTKEPDKPKISKSRIFMFNAGIALLALAFFLPIPFYAKLVIYIVSYLLIGGRVLLRAGRNIARGRIFDENFLMCTATIGAFGLGEFPEAVSVMLFYQIGEFFQDSAVNRSRKSIENLMDIRPDYANIESGGTLLRVNPEEVHRGDIIIVKPGEKIPLDGTVLTGSSSLDTSSLTGETMPRTVQEGSEVLSGSVNKTGLLSIRVTKEFGESTVSKILDLVQNAGSKKSPTEKFITKFAKVYTPVVVFSALALALLPPLIIPGATFSDWIGRALIFLLVSCPCALVLSIPLSFFGGIGAASRKGVLIKGGEYLEALNHVDTFIFDKTGTLTYGEFSVASMHSQPPYSDDQLLEYAAAAESFSSHPIAVSIQKAYGKPIDQSRISGYREIAGLGVSCQIDGRQVFAGNRSLLEQNNVPCTNEEAYGSAVYVAAGGSFVGYIMIADRLREDSKRAVASLRSLGIKRLIMLTGDNKKTADNIAGELGLDEAYAELLPHQKVEKLEELAKSSNGKTAFVGDGINDAPVLARADIGFALGGLGSDAAIEAADVVLMTDEPGRLADAIHIARKTRINAMQNIVIALSVKGVLLLLSAFGLANMWEAIFGDVGVAIIAIFNSMRLLRLK